MCVRARHCVTETAPETAAQLILAARDPHSPHRTGRPGPSRDAGLGAEGARAVMAGLAGRAGVEALDLGSAPRPSHLPMAVR